MEERDGQHAPVPTPSPPLLPHSLHQGTLEIESCRQKIRDAQSDPQLNLPIGGALRRELERVKRRYHALQRRGE